MCPDIEYPDNAGYPDGMGFLDEGTAVAAEPAAFVAELDVPSADVDDDIVIVADAGGYRALLGGREVASMRVVRSGDEPVVIRSTFVEPEARHRGLATALIAHVLDELRDDGARVVVECEEVAQFVDLHREHADLLA